MATASVNGITVGYDDVGGGEPLVLIHGHPFDRSMWAPQVGEFAGSGWRVIVPDLRGYGESSVVPGTVAWETFARDIAGLLDHLQVEGAVLGGLSMGGQIVMEFFRLFPAGIRALLLADTFCQAETEDGKRSATTKPTGCSARACAVMPTRCCPRWWRRTTSKRYLPWPSTSRP